VFLVWVVGFLEFGDRGLDGERAMMVEFEGAAGHVGVFEENGEFLGEFGEV